MLLDSRTFSFFFFFFNISLFSREMDFGWWYGGIQLMHVVFGAFASTVDQAEAIVVAVIKKSLELVFCYLEKSEFKCEDFSIQVCCFLVVSKLCVREGFIIGFFYSNSYKFCRRPMSLSMEVNLEPWFVCA